MLYYNSGAHVVRPLKVGTYIERSCVGNTLLTRQLLASYSPSLALLSERMHHQ